MKKIKIFSTFSIIFLFLFGCQTNKTNNGTTGNTYSIRVEENLNLNNLSYGWYIITTPIESKLISKDLFIKNFGKEMSFKPDIPGDYVFELIVFNNNGKSIKRNTYEFNINLLSTTKINVDSTSTLNQNNNNDKLKKIKKKQDLSEKKSIKKQNKKKTKLIKKKLMTANQIESFNGNYTIQMFSEKTPREAEEKMLELKNKGLDSYIQKAYFEKTDQLWYRVRVGNFVSKDEANEAAKEISDFTNFKTWVDKVRVE